MIADNMQTKVVFQPIKCTHEMSLVTTSHFAIKLRHSYTRCIGITVYSSEHLFTERVQYDTLVYQKVDTGRAPPQNFLQKVLKKNHKMFLWEPLFPTNYECYQKDVILLQD